MLCFLDFRDGRDIKFAFCTTRSPTDRSTFLTMLLRDIHEESS